MSEREIGLYIHIPFCRAKCRYCDFNSYADREEAMPSYFDALEKEMEIYTEKLKDRVIGTVFIGGGTPSLVDTRFIYEILNTCKDSFHIKNGAEITIESNPGTLSYDKLMSYKVSGVNRLSIGLQAWQNRLLEKLGRVHQVEDFAENFKLARKVGFKNINVDLIFGIQGQTLRDWKETLQRVIKLKPEHISCYSLKIEEGTAFYDMLENGELDTVDDDIDRDMYSEAIEILTQNGYRHYEISNFALPGYECKHNLVYWNTMEYLGVGAGAHSYIDGVRYSNKCEIEEYIKYINNDLIPLEDEQRIDKNEMMLEFMMLGLRLVDGIDIDEFKKRFEANIFDAFGDRIKKLQGKELISVEGGRIKLTDLGLNLANQVFVEFI